MPLDLSSERTRDILARLHQRALELALADAAEVGVCGFDDEAADVQTEKESLEPAQRAALNELDPQGAPIR